MRSLALATAAVVCAATASAAPLSPSVEAPRLAPPGALVEDATVWIGALEALGAAGRDLTLAPLGASSVLDAVWIAPVTAAEFGDGAFRLRLGDAGFALRQADRTVFAARGLSIDAAAGTAVADAVEGPAGAAGPVDLVTLFALEPEFRPALAAFLLVAGPDTGARLSGLFGADLTVAPGAVMAALHLGPVPADAPVIPTPVPGAAGLLIAALAALGLARRRR